MPKAKSALIRLNKEELTALKNDFKDFIEAHDDPNLPQFLTEYKAKDARITRRYLESNKELAGLYEWCLIKEEAWLIEKKKELPMAIFRLKQPRFGYIDTPQNKTEVNVTFTNSVPRPKRKKVDNQSTQITEVSDT